MNPAAAVTPMPSPGDAATLAQVAYDFRLPLREADFDAGLAGLLHAAVNGAPRRDSLTGLCTHLARLLRLPLAMIARRAEGGTLLIEATSAENGLWLELQHIPERWDGGLCGQGPAAEALRAGIAVQMHPRHDGYTPWAAAARAERVQRILAIPMPMADGASVAELCFDGEIPRGASAATVTVGRLAQGIRRFLEDLDTIARQVLVARALAGAGNAAFITDLEGTIVWSNPAFSALSGYSPAEVRGRNPNLLSSGQQGTRYYRDLWRTIRAGKVWSSETVDRAKDGRDYTIRQTISPIAQDERITHYLSIHEDVGAERQTRERLELASHYSPDTGLLTRSAFVSAFAGATGEAPERPAMLVVVAARGLQRAAAAMGEETAGLVATALARRVREAFPEPDLAGSFGTFEYALLLRGDVTDARLEARLRTLREKLVEPLPCLGAIPDLDIHCGAASYPADGRVFHEVWLKADRQLANEPYPRARRDAPH
ncbi:MAG: PAS domain-containing protein [Gammaproteobacteria bacterium]